MLILATSSNYFTHNKSSLVFVYGCVSLVIISYYYLYYIIIILYHIFNAQMSLILQANRLRGSTGYQQLVKGLSIKVFLTGGERWKVTVHF